MTFLRQWAIRDAGFQPQEVADFRVPRCDYLGDFGVMSWYVMEILSRYLTVIYITIYDEMSLGYTVSILGIHICIFFDIYIYICIYVYLYICVCRTVYYS